MKDTDKRSARLKAIRCGIRDTAFITIAGTAALMSLSWVLNRDNPGKLIATAFLHVVLAGILLLCSFVAYATETSGSRAVAPFPGMRARWRAGVYVVAAFIIAVCGVVVPKLLL